MVIKNSSILNLKCIISLLGSTIYCFEEKDYDLVKPPLYTLNIELSRLIPIRDSSEMSPKIGFTVSRFNKTY